MIPDKTLQEAKELAETAVINIGAALSLINAYERARRLAVARCQLEAAQKLITDPHTRAEAESEA